MEERVIRREKTEQTWKADIKKGMNLMENSPGIKKSNAFRDTFSTKPTLPIIGAAGGQVFLENLVSPCPVSPWFSCLL